jgi:hypothetical protein
MIVDCAALDTKYLTDELEWNAQYVFLSQNLRYMEALLAEKCCRWKRIMLLQPFDDLGARRGSHILPERANRLPISRNEIANDHTGKKPL